MECRHSHRLYGTMTALFFIVWNELHDIIRRTSIRQSFSNVDSVIFRFFFRVSSVLLSKPFLRSWYCVTCLRRIVSHRGVKSINAVTTFACKKSFFTFHYTGWVCKWILWRYPQCGIISKMESLQIVFAHVMTLMIML